VTCQGQTPVLAAISTASVAIEFVKKYTTGVELELVWLMHHTTTNSLLKRLSEHHPAFETAAAACIKILLGALKKKNGIFKAEAVGADLRSNPLFATCS
jgi:hypothetical protein